MNRLANEQSAYLRHASHQKIDWRPWSDEAFELARRANKPVFLSTGAVWCHWCHVMAGECFENDEIAALMNELFINVKLDRDERPDIDRRYQEAVAAMGSGSGWPLSVFLTPDKEAFYGGTYFPPEDLQGRPGFKQVLRAVSAFYRDRRSDATDFAARVMAVLKPEPLPAGEIDEELLAEAEKNVLSHVDLKNGGFGQAPKFPLPGALEFLLRRSGAGKGEAAGAAARAMLDAMARGGFHDQLGGGFHRYSVDESWTIPHFEKMADDNAGLLKNYLDGYSLFGDDRYRAVAQDVIDFTKEVLADPGGGFYASQDADVTSDDEGGYFTWSDEELRQILTPDEHALLSAHFVHPRGRMHHDPSKIVLAADTGLEAPAGLRAAPAADALGRIGEKLLAHRGKRAAPFVDTTLYTSLNGMMIASYLRAYMTLDIPGLKEFALKSLERIGRERFIEGALFHSPGVRGGLDDYIHAVDAYVTAYEATAERRYLGQAEALMARCLERFLDVRAGGFFDTEGEVLGTRLKRIEDVPHPSGNAVAIVTLLKLGAMTGKEEYRREAERALRIFAGPALPLGVHAGAYFCALHSYFNSATLMVEAAPESALARAARAYAEPSYAAILYKEDRGRVILCAGEVCHEPVHDPEGLRSFLKKLGRP